MRTLQARLHCAGFGGSGRRGLLAALLALAAVFTLGASPVRAADTVLTFDDVKADAQGFTTLNTQYQSQGITFQNGRYLPDGGALSAPNLVYVSRSGELGSAFLRADFTNPHHSFVTVNVENTDTDEVDLLALDIGGNHIGEVDLNRTKQPGTYHTYTVTSPNRNIAAIIVAGNPGGSPIYMDNIRFDNIGTLEGPDFAFYPAGGNLILTPGGPPQSTTVSVVRRAGSTGGINLSLLGLPNNIHALIEPNPMTGNSAVITLSADPSATPVKSRSFTVAGVPSATAGAYGTRYVSLNATVVDSFDARIVGMEVTQGIQPYDLPQRDPANLAAPASYQQVGRAGVPLAQGGTTAVRVFTDLAADTKTLAVPNLNVSLNGYRNGQLLPGSPLSFSKGAFPALGPDTMTDDLRSGKSGGDFAFTLPADWAKGTITLVATLSQQPQFGLPTAFDANANNNTYSMTDIAFTRTRDLYMLPFSLDVQGLSNDEPDVVLADAKNLIPVGDTQFHIPKWIGHIDVTDIWNDTTVDGTKRGANALQRLRDRADDLNILTHTNALVVGIFPGSDKANNIRSQEYSGCEGPFWSCDNLVGAIVQHENRPYSTVMHEIGHALGRNHASPACGANKEKSPFDDWPTDEQGFIQGVGFDRRDNTVLFPPRDGSDPKIYDYESYCGDNGSDDPDKWISVRGWNDLMKSLAVAAPGDAGGALTSPVNGGVRPLQAGGPTIIIRGYIDPDGVAQITKVGPGNPSSPIPADPTSPYHAIAKDSDGNVIADVPMKQEEIHIHGEESEIPRYLSAEIPDTNNIASVEIVNAGATLVQKTRSAHPPVVTNLVVEADTIRAGVRSSHVTWTATDADGDPLMAKVDYSADGGKTWNPVYFGVNTGDVSLPSALLATSAQGMVAVRVSDGFGETRAESAPFATSGSAPTVRIVSPAEDTTVKAGATLNLQGDAQDDLGNALSNADLNWYDGDGLLGSGGTITVSTLAPGTHTLRLTARDAQGRIGSRKVEVQVNP